MSSRRSKPAESQPAEPKVGRGHGRPTSARARLDADGRLLAWTDTEQAQYAQAFREGMARLEAIPDDPAEDDREFFRAMDADRPECPRFEGMY